MYIPAEFKLKDKFIREYLLEANYAQLVTSWNDDILSTPVVLVVNELEETKELNIIVHIASANQQVNHLDSGANLLITVNVEDAYISTKWYDKHNTVPTWNYIQLQISGQCICINDPDEVLEQMGNLYQNIDPSQLSQWRNADTKYLKKLTQYLKMYRLQLNYTIEGVAKLSQDKSREIQDKIIKEMKEMGKFKLVDAMNLNKQNDILNF
ncbi:MAG: FMN-binding negative transcriptional regulator [Bacteroidota bacterium]|nr:FMN-binding negative transcriptional regulator [Bacteroidota bacterium]